MHGMSKSFSAFGFMLLLVPVVPMVWTGTSNAIQSTISQARVEEKKLVIQEQEQTVRNGINERQKTLDVASKAGEHTSYSKKILKNYVYSPRLNPQPETRHYKPDELVQVFDKNGVCLGRIRNNKWEWRVWYVNACSEDSRR